MSTAVLGRFKGAPHLNVNGSPVRLRFVQTIIVSAVAAVAGACVIAGIYFATFEVNYHIAAHLIGSWPAHTIHILYLKNWWDGLFGLTGPWPVFRHGLRDQGEPVLATFFVMTIAARWKPGKDKRVGPVSLVVRVLLVIILAVPMILAAIWLINYGLPDLWHRLFPHHVIRNPVHLPHFLAFVSTFLATWPWELLIAGVIIGRIMKEIFKPVGVTVQGFFIDRRVDKARDAARDDGLTLQEASRRYRIRFPWPPAARERYWYTLDNSLTVHDRQGNIGIAVWGMAIVLGVFALVGAYAKYWVGTGHAPFIR